MGVARFEALKSLFTEYFTLVHVAPLMSFPVISKRLTMNRKVLWVSKLCLGRTLVLYISYADQKYVFMNLLNGLYKGELYSWTLLQAKLETLPLEKLSVYIPFV